MQGRREKLALWRQVARTHGVHTSVPDHEPPGSNPAVDLLSAEAELQELPSRQDTMAAPRNLGDPPLSLPRGDLTSNSDVNTPLGAHRPTMPAGDARDTPTKAQISAERATSPARPYARET